ncbi:54S ribosomal protein L2 mitochondrial [Cryptotrichosporon argae]
MLGPLVPRSRLLGSRLTSELKIQLFAGPSGRQTQIRTATKRGGGSSKNGRDSESKRLGVKKFTNQYVLPGQILVRQRGASIHAGQHVGVGKDATLFALEPGFVKFYTSPSPFPHTAPAGPILDLASTLTASATAAGALRVAAPVQKPRGYKQFIGIVRSRDDALPRDQLREGRDRRFYGAPLRETA